ncbi:hypothetical protein [Bradyrhizobium sp. USDA 4469]
MTLLFTRVAFIAVFSIAVVSASHAQSEGDEADSDYSQLAHNPGVYVGRTMSFFGKVVQSIQNGNAYELRINVSKGRNDSWHNTVWVDYHANSPTEDRIITDDVVEFRGKFVGIKTYQSVARGPIQIPHIVACAIRAKPQETPGLIVLRKPIACQEEQRGASSSGTIDGKSPRGAAPTAQPPTNRTSNVRATLRPQGGSGMINLFGTKVRSNGSVVGAVNNRHDTTVGRVRIVCDFTKWESGSPAKEFIVDRIIPPDGFAQFVSAPLGIGPPEPEPISCSIAGYDN